MWTGTLKRQSRRCCLQVGLRQRQAASNDDDLQPHAGACYMASAPLTSEMQHRQLTFSGSSDVPLI